MLPSISITLSSNLSFKSDVFSILIWETYLYGKYSKKSFIVFIFNSSDISFSFCWSKFLIEKNKSEACILINNVDKYYVLSALKTIDKLANTKLIVYNSNIGKPIEIVIKDWDEDFHNVKYYQDVFNEIEKYFFKNPSYAKFAESILDTIALWHFGVAPEYKSDKLSKNIIQYIEFLTQSKDIEDVEFFKWIESILRKQEI